jgi:hypothetical protein
MSPLLSTRERLGRIIGRGEVLLASLHNGDGLSDEATVLAWRLTAVTVVAHLVSQQHHYRRELARIAHECSSGPERSLELTLGVLHGLRDDIESGALTDVRGHLRAEVLLDLLDRAEDHYERGYHEAAALLLFTILEDQLRSLARLNDLPTERSLDVMSHKLCQLGVYDADTHRAVQRWNELGQRLIQHVSPAQRAEVAELLDGVARFLDEHPALRKTLPRDLQAAFASDSLEDPA